MHGPGNGSAPSIVSIATTPVSLAVLPRTGLSTAMQIALAVLVGLVCWALVYLIIAKLRKN